MSLLNRFGQPVLKAEWLVTSACQLYCSYCSIAHRDIKEMRREDKLIVLDKLKKWNVFPVLYGGEVTVSKDFEAMLEYCKEIDLDYAVISHGLVDLFKLEKWCREYNLRNWSVSVDTLDFSEREGFDYEVVRKARSGYATLIYTQGLVRDRVTCTTITKQNIREIPEIIKEMSRIGV